MLWEIPQLRRVTMRRVLIADDKENMRWVLERALSQAGYDVETAEDGQLALDRALTERPDLVLVDLKMPKMDGLSLLKKLKEHYPDLMIVMMTAHGSTATVVEAMKAGAQDYLIKPFDIEELLITVAKAFEVESLREQVDYLKGDVQSDGWQLVGNSDAMQAVKHLVERVGGEKTIKVDVRIIAATNRDLLKEAQKGRFREDIPYLAEHFLKKLKYWQGKTLGPGVLTQLMAYDWPGNVRELENVVERMAIISQEAVIGVDGLLVYNTILKEEKSTGLFVLPREGVSLEEIEISFLQQAMEQTGGNQSQAAKRLGLSRHAFLYRLEKYGIDPHWGI